MISLSDISNRLFVGLLLAVSFACGCAKLETPRLSDRIWPSNDRDWKPEQAVMPFAEVHGTQYVVHNIRNCTYHSADDYVVEYSDRLIDLSQIQSVDFIMVPFKKTPSLAHTMLSFGLDDGTYLVVSVEVRKEKGESYNALAGLARKYELMYVVGEERDLIRLRTRHYDHDVFVFPTVADPEQSQRLFADVVQRMNQLVQGPEFYHTVSNNCTSNLKDHVNRLSPNRIGWNWKILLPGYSAQHAYESGLLDNRIPFEDLEAIAYVNDLAEQHFDEPQFSLLIRSKRQRLQRYAARQQSRGDLLDGRRNESLQPTRRR